MTLNERCNCMVDTCWRRGMCEFCVNNHGGNRSSVVCALTPEVYEERKRHWETHRDEPHYPTNTALGILSKETLDVSKNAILGLRDVQKAARQCLQELLRFKNEECFNQEELRNLLSKYEQMYGNLQLLIEKAEAATLLGKTAKALVPDSFC